MADEVKAPARVGVLVAEPDELLHGLPDGEHLHRSTVLAEVARTRNDDLVRAGGARLQRAREDVGAAGNARREHRRDRAVAPEDRRSAVLVVDGASDRFGDDEQDEVRELRRVHEREDVEVREEARARRVDVEGRHLQLERSRDVAGLGGRRRVHHRRAGDEEPDRLLRDPGARDRHLGGAASGLGVAVERRFRGGAGVAVPRRLHVVERQRRPPRADADALEDPLLVRPDVEVFEEPVRDLVLGVEVPEAVQREAHASPPETCSPPSTRTTSPLIHAASSVVSR